MQLQETTTKLTDAPFSFPAQDVNQHGNLKTVRGRVLRKLLKYDFKALYPGMLILMISLIACSILLSVQIRLYESQTTPSDDVPWFLILTIMLAVCLNFGTTIGSLLLPHKRYRKNFFKSEGYLTFSIPASAHEQILSKHIASILCYVAGWLANLVSLVIILLAFNTQSSPNPGPESSMLPEKAFETAVIIFELVILALMFPVLLTTLDGAVAWWEQRLPERHRRLLVVLIAIGIISFLQTLGVVFILNGVWEAFFQLPPILIFFIFICIGAALICSFYAYEIKSFKKRINLK